MTNVLSGSVLNTSSNLDCFRMSQSWWEKFEDTIKHSEVPILYKDIFKSPLLEIDKVGKIVSKMQREQDLPGRIRVYDGIDRRNDLASNILSLKAPLGKFEDTFKWMCEVSKTEKLAFIINDLQEWNDALCRRSAAFLEGFYETKGMPPDGVELVLFGGNYESTPFGVHRGFEHAFLAHLGPAPKEFYLWSPDLFKSLTGGVEAVFDYEWLIPHATSYTLEPNDLLYLPAYWFHIGAQKELSCSIAMALYQGRDIDVVHSTIMQSTPKDYENGVVLPYLPINTSHNPLCSLLENATSKIVRTRIYEQADKMWYPRLSNGGLRRKQKILFPPLDLTLDSSIKLSNPFKLYWKVDEMSNYVQIYSRHQMMKFKYHRNLQKIFFELNSGSILSFSEIQECLGDIWSIEAIIGFFKVLSQLGGLELADKVVEKVDIDVRYAEQLDLSGWVNFVGEFFEEFIFNLPVPREGFIVELGTYESLNFQKLCNNFGAERCIGYDVVNYGNHPRVKVQDVRTLVEGDGIPIALGWNDLSEWRSSPESKLSGFKFLTKNIVPGGYYIDSSLSEDFLTDLDMSCFTFVVESGCINVFQKNF